MGAGSAAKYGPAETGDDEPEAAWSSPGSQAEAMPWGGETSRSADGPDEADEQAERATVGESRWDRMVPPYVDDLTRQRRDREPAGPDADDLAARDDSPAGEPEAAAGQDAGSVWSAWSSAGGARAGGQARSGGRDLREPGEQRDEDELRGEGEERGEGGLRGERPGRAEIDLPGRVVTGGGPAAGELAESKAAAGDVTSDDAAPDHETGEDELAAEPTADVAGDERDGAGEARPAAALDATPGAALTGAASGTNGADEAAASDTGADAAEPGPAEPGMAETGMVGAGIAEGAGTAQTDAAEDNGAQQDAAETDGAAGVVGARSGDGIGGSADAGSADAGSGENTGQGAGDGGAPLDGQVTIVPGVARYHRRGCILIRFLSDGDLETMTRREAEATGSVPCKACQPDKPDPSA